MRPVMAVILGGALGLLGVAAGAFGAHGLRDVLDPQQLQSWRTAAHYQQVHAVLLVTLGLGAAPPRRAAARLLTTAMWLFVAGIVLFSGSLYALLLTGLKALGPVTPIGGTCLLAGWAVLTGWAAGEVRQGLGQRSRR